MNSPRCYKMRAAAAVSDLKLYRCAEALVLPGGQPVW